MKKLILILLVFISLTSCKNINSNEFITNTDNVVISKKVWRSVELRTTYVYKVKHRQAYGNYSVIVIYSNDNSFKVGDILELKAK